jgi:hypothetical protein
MKNKTQSTLALTLATAMLATTAAQANPIVRSFHSVRAAGMGDVRYTTGLFEENFFANPARLIRNGEDLFQLPKISVEAGSATISSVSAITKGGDDISKFTDVVGKPISARFQMVFPGYYNRSFLGGNWAFAVGMVVATQTAAIVGQNAYIDPFTVINAGPVITLARKFLEEDRLSVGVNAHAEARGSSGSMIGVVDVLKGTNLGNAAKGGSSAGYDFDLGVSFRPHWNLGGFEYEVGGALNNILGGKYNNVKKNLLASWNNGDPMAVPTSFGAGISATHQGLPFIDQLTIALEGTDFGNNKDGSLFRCLHLGAELTTKKLSFRGGINQGYLAAGFGLDLWVFDLNIATYGEEMGLNAGTREDRRYAAQFGFKI